MNDPNEKQQLYAEQVRQLYRQTPVALLSAPIVSLVMIIILWDVIPHWILVAWYSIVLLLTISKYLHVRKFWSSSQSPDSVDRWGNCLIIGAALSGIVWGSAGVFLFPVHSSIHQLFITFMICGMVAGASGTYSVIMRVFSAYILLALLPLTIRFFLFGDKIHIGIGSMILLYVFLMFVNAKRVNAAIISSLKLQFENRDLVESLTVEKKRLEELNTEYADEIVQRKQAEEESRLSKTLLRDVIDLVPAFICAKDLDGRFILVNKKLTDFYGTTVNEMMGMLHADMCEDKEELRDILAADREVIESGKPKIIPEEMMENPDGSITILETYKIPFTAHDEPAVLIVAADITKRKQAEEELQKVQKLKSIGTLAGGIAHDFNNILMGLFGNISIAKEELSKDHPVLKFLEEAEKCRNRATRLTKQLLTFAKGGEPVKEHISIGTLVEEIVRFGRSGSNVIPVFEQAEDLWMAEVDKGQMQQVFSNLTINANQAMPDGGHLFITLENADIKENLVPNLNQGKYIKVTVRDEGTGINQKHLERIFDPYFSTKPAGSGLGLATTYSIINKHSGHIIVDSELGKGTTFTLYLPASKSQQLPETKQPLAKPSTREQTARILVMDDDEMVRCVTAKMLEVSGFSVETASDGKQAVEMYTLWMDAGKAFDVVIMDITIPGGIGGKEAIKDILEIDPEARAIVSSGYTDDPVMANYAEYGFKGIAKKPYTMSDLGAVLSQVLEKGRG